MNKREGAMLGRKAEIDTRAPFSSVKEAVSLFGDKVLAGEVLYAATTNIKHKHKQKQVQQSGAVNNDEKGADESWRIGEVAAELKETRENLERAREQSMVMAHCLSSLQEELERTKRELQQLKLKQRAEILTEKHVVPMMASESSRFDEEFQKKRYVTFASESHVLLPPDRVEILQRHPSLKKTKNHNKSLIPLIGGIFSRTKRSGCQRPPSS